MSEMMELAPPGPPGDAEIRDLLERARRGDADALPGLRAALDGHPEVCRAYGDLAAHARTAWINLIGGPDLALGEALSRRAVALRAELAGPAPTPIEALLAERVVACWLQVNYSDAAAAQAGAISLKQAAFAQHRQDAAHRRYLTALGALATVRRLLPVAEPAGMLPTSPCSRGPRGDVGGDDQAASRPAGHEVDREGGDPSRAGLLLAFEPPRAGADRGVKTRSPRQPESTATS